MTRLEQHLITRIRTDGPLTVAQYMAECLTHPKHGYYTTHDPLGAKGDFITAPEISQMFGELIGLSLAQTWMDQGTPSNIVLAELGPGRGTLMADLLRATATVPGFHDALSVHLVEASPILRQTQSSTIPCAVTHHDALATLPQGPLYLIANEFFDALPIRQFLRDGRGWRERVIGVQDEALAFGLADQTNPTFLTHRLDDTKDGDLIEHCAAATAITNEIGQRITDQGGAALIIDYGDWRSQGDTFQALRSHKPTSPLYAPGEADLTAHIDFEALSLACAPAKHSRVTPQGIFLERLGITERAQALAKNLVGPALASHIAAHRRLTHPEEMGTLFKVMGLYPHQFSPPPGLES